MSLTLFFAVLAGVGAGAAWGYRTALYVALGRTRPRDPGEPRALVPFTGSNQRRDELTR